MDFSLSSNVILQEMLALTALRNRTADCGAALNPDFEAGMRLAVRDAFSLLTLRLADVVTDVEMDAEDAEPSDPIGTYEPPMRLTIDLPADYPAGLCRALLRRMESAVAKFALSLTESSGDWADYDTLALADVAAIRSQLFAATPLPRLRPYH